MDRFEVLSIIILNKFLQRMKYRSLKSAKRLVIHNQRWKKQWPFSLSPSSLSLSLSFSHVRQKGGSETSSLSERRTNASDKKMDARVKSTKG